MAQGLIIAGIMTPIVKEVTFPGYTHPVGTPDVGLNIEQGWLAGVTVGHSFADPNGSSTFCGMTDGILDIHNGYYLCFDYKESHPGGYTTSEHLLQCFTSDGTDPISIPGFDTQYPYDIVVVPAIDPTSFTIETVETRACLVKFTFPDATDPMAKIPNYYYYIIQHRTVADLDGHVYDDSYTPVMLQFQFAYANDYDSNYGIYLDPIDIPDHEDPNDEGDPSDEDGGDGDHTADYDPIPIPNSPTLGAANAGFITMYKLGLAAINTFASDMFASNVWEAIRLFFSNPIDFLVGCMLLPFEPTTGSSYHPKFGLIAFEHAYPAVSNQYKDIDCGSINITKYWGSCFDYEPFTKIQIWLPYIGYRDLPVDEIMGMTVSVKYRCDCLTGDCVAFVYTGVVGQTGPQVERVIGQFYGNCGVRVPFGSVSYDSAVAASIQLMGAAASIGLSPGAHGTPAMQKGDGGKAYEGIVSPQDVGLINAGINVVSSMKPNVHKGGAAGASTGYMSIQKPYIIRRIPRQNLPSNFMNLKGYPSNIGGKLADFTGLAVVDDIQLNDIPAMEDERKEIIALLKGGVLI